MKLNNKGFTGLELVAVLAIIGFVVGGGVIARSVFGGTKRAQTSTQTTAALVQATTVQGAAAAASVVEIGKANSVAPASPSKDFITAEIPVTLSRLPTPDAQEHLAAEQRRSAVMEGRVEEARKLYVDAARYSARLQVERDEALAAKQASDLVIEKVAAAEQAATVQKYIYMFVAFVCLAAFVYAKFFGVNLVNLGKMAADIRAGGNPIEALSTYTAPWQHKIVQKYAKLNTDLKDPV